MKQDLQAHSSMCIHGVLGCTDGSIFSSCAHTHEGAADGPLLGHCASGKVEESNTLVWSHGEEGP